MKNRRKSRELTLQALFYMDMRQNISMEALELYQGCFDIPVESEPFFLALAKGVMENILQIDRIIERFSSNWKISRMPCVDRNIMRTAVYEMMFCRDIPIKVSINEAIDIGKKFGTEESGAFINGILDSIHIALEKKEIQTDFSSRVIIPESISYESYNKPEKGDEPEPAKFSQVKGHPGVVRRRVKNVQACPDAIQKQ
ncbi:Transcription antitermination protein [Desulfonema limicola]|uniref:Transcription antitermination protein NusB n=1 Tax=Desulfonema limicola TaxID=45656 RepID=A0A975B648_9BACT|nr:transcription antitermination factor NusB [Desulfonema limicola]QTA79501.1 Transcription antitermination protein [Desulfonema limicola]